MRSTWPNSHLSSLSPWNSHPSMCCLWNRFWNNFAPRKLLSSTLVFRIDVGFRSSSLRSIMSLPQKPSGATEGVTAGNDMHNCLSMKLMMRAFIAAPISQWTQDDRQEVHVTVTEGFSFCRWAQRDLAMSLRQSTFPAAGAREPQCWGAIWAAHYTIHTNGHPCPGPP